MQEPLLPGGQATLPTNPDPPIRVQPLWSGWQKGVIASCICNIVVLIFSLVLLIWVTASKPMDPNGTYILWQGSSKSIQRSDTIIHLGLNVMSGIVLAGSNYTLQVLIAPTRSDIDKAHSQNRYLDIGISSLHNWLYVSWQRKLLYIFLLAITLPVHLLYNSIIFSAETNLPTDPDLPKFHTILAEGCSLENMCLSSIELVPQLLIVVIVSSVLKTAALSLLVFSTLDPLVTIGDAVASFLDSPDSISKDMGPLSVMELQRQISNQKIKCDLSSTQYNKAWKTQHHCYFRAATPLRWFLTTSLAIVWCLAGISWSLGVVMNLPQSVSNTISIIGSILLVNTPQVVLSSIYLCYNALFTCISLSVEWMSFYKHKKGLRVSKPAGEQRGTYFLSLPYKYSVPLIMKSILLHWIVSQGIFIERVDMYNSDRVRTPSKDTRSMFISILFLLITMSPVVMVLLLIPIGLGFRKFDAAMPLARSNSMVISAACHPVRASGKSTSIKKLSTKKVQYGVISDIPLGGYRVGFSDKEVRPLVPGEFYR